MIFNISKVVSYLDSMEPRPSLIKDSLILEPVSSHHLSCSTGSKAKFYLETKLDTYYLSKPGWLYLLLFSNPQDPI